MADAFFVPTDDATRFLATPHTAGLWAPDAQHAGPPSALLARAVEQTPTTCDGPVTVARLTVDILGSVPVGEVAVTARVVRPGRSVELVEAELVAAGRPTMVARVWRIRRAADPLRADLAGDDPLPADLAGDDPPDVAPPRPDIAARFRDPAMHVGYLAAMDWHFVEGGFETPGPARVWARQRMPLVAGEEPTPLQRLVVLADSGNGLSRVFDFATWWFINTELSIHLFRAPVGEWMYVTARTRLGPDGTGLAETELFDADGRIGAGAQSLLIGRR